MLIPTKLKGRLFAYSLLAVSLVFESLRQIGGKGSAPYWVVWLCTLGCIAVCEGSAWLQNTKRKKTAILLEGVFFATLALAFFWDFGHWPVFLQWTRGLLHGTLLTAVIVGLYLAWRAEDRKERFARALRKRV